MKIISTHSNRFACHHCKTVAEYDNGDIHTKQDPPSYDEYEMRDVYYVKCPTCATAHTINPTAHEKSVAVSRKKESHY